MRTYSQLSLDFLYQNNLFFDPAVQTHGIVHVLMQSKHVFNVAFNFTTFEQYKTNQVGKKITGCNAFAKYRWLEAGD